MNQSVKINYGKVTELVEKEFLVEERALFDTSVPTYYLAPFQEVGQSFPRPLKELEGMGLTASLRRQDDGRLMLKVFPRERRKTSRVLVNWVLFFATVAYPS